MRTLPPSPTAFNDCLSEYYHPFLPVAPRETMSSPFKVTTGQNLFHGPGGGGVGAGGAGAGLCGESRLCCI